MGLPAPVFVSVGGVRARPYGIVAEVINAHVFTEGFPNAVCGVVGGGSGAAADGEPGADEFVAGDGGVSAGGICGDGEAGGVAEDEAEIVAANSEEK
jgi:hypothetical protein